MDKWLCSDCGAENTVEKIGTAKESHFLGCIVWQDILKDGK